MHFHKQQYILATFPVFALLFFGDSVAETTHHTSVHQTVQLMYHYRQHCVQWNAPVFILNYSEADFEVFCPTGATRCTDGGEIWHGGRDQRSPPPCQISPLSVQRLGYRSPKLKFLRRFDQNVGYKRPTGAYPLRDFHKICRVCTPFHVLAVKILLNLLNGLWSYVGFKFTGSGYPQIFSTP